MELTVKQLQLAESKLRLLFPEAQRVLGSLQFKNTKTKADPIKIFVDRWPDFDVVICKPHSEPGDNSFNETIVYAKDEAALEETIRNPSVLDWNKYFCVETNLTHRNIFTAVAAEKQIPSRNVTVSHIMSLKDVSNLPTLKSSGISLASLNESHVELINQTWKFGKSDWTVKMIRNMVKHLPSCCVLDAESRPVSWVLTYPSCALGMLYTLPEHRGKGYARVVMRALAQTLCVQGFPVYGLVEETNAASYKLFKSLGFNKVSSYREATFDFNFPV